MSGGTSSVLLKRIRTSVKNCLDFLPQNYSGTITSWNDKKSQSKIRLDEMWTLLLSVASWVSLSTSPNPWLFTRVTFLWKSDTCCVPEGLSPWADPQRMISHQKQHVPSLSLGESTVSWSTLRRLEVTVACCGYKEPWGPEYERSCLPKAHGNHGKRKGRGQPW